MIRSVSYLMKISTNSRRRTDPAARVRCRGMRGLTLVELMVYLAILSIISVGIMQMVLEVQTSNITTLTHADN